MYMKKIFSYESSMKYIFVYKYIQIINGLFKSITLFVSIKKIQRNNNYHCSKLKL